MPLLRMHARRQRGLIALRACLPACHTPIPADLRRSAWCFGGWLCLFLPWTLLFMTAGSSLLGSVYSRLDAYQIDLAGLGIGF
jgi:hypothetical protein